MRSTLRLDARVLLAVGAALLVTVVAVVLGVVWRIHDETSRAQRAALDREAMLATNVLAGGASLPVGSEPTVALFLGGRRLGADVDPPAGFLQHAGDVRYRVWHTTGGRLFLERGVRIGAATGVVVASSALPAHERAALLRIEAESLVPIVVGVLGGGMVLFGRAARRHRARLLEIGAAADRIGAGDLAARLNPRGTDELASVATRVDGLAERLEHVEDARQRMLAAVAHDLRAPLTVIRTYTHALRRGEEGALQLERLNVIEDEVSRVADLVDDLLAVGRLRASALLVERGPADLGALVTAAVERWKPLADERGVTLRCRVPRGPLPRELDARRLDQALANLVENGLTHAGARTVEVALAVGDDEDEITVTDDGCGIADEHVPFLFDPFYTAGRRTAGSGLGLAIARELVGAHGGSLAVLPHVAGGARFSIRLPRRVATATAESVPC